MGTPPPKKALKRKEQVSFIGFIISNTPDIKFEGILSVKLSKCFEHFRQKRKKKCRKCLGSLAALSFFMSFTVVNKMSSRLAGPTLQIICRQITPLLPVCLFTLALVYMEEARALCLKHRGLFGSVQIWPLSFHAIVSSPAYLSRPLRSCRTSTQWQWSG